MGGFHCGPHGDDGRGLDEGSSNGKEEMDTTSREMKENRAAILWQRKAKVGEPWTNPPSLKWAPRWQAVLFAKVGTQRRSKRRCKGSSTRLPCLLCKDMHARPWIWPVPLRAHALQTQGDPERPKEEKAATHFSPTLW